MAEVRPAAFHTSTVLAAFFAYGALWGPYLATLPDVQRATGADAAQLGHALLVSALVTMPGMYVVGRLLDRFGRPVVVAAIVVFAIAATGPSLSGSVPALVLATALLGFGSGACNVVVVALAATAESRTGARVMNRAHALFSVGLLAGSLGTGVARTQGVPGHVVATGVAVGVVLWAIAAARRLPVDIVRRARRVEGRRPRPPVLLLALVAAAAMVVESGVQQWSSVYLATATGAGAGVAAVAPGVFAAAMAAGRLGGHVLAARVSERLLLVCSGLLSGAAVLVLAAATDPVHGLVAVAAVGGAMSVSLPTVYGLVGRRVPAEDRGAAIGAVASVASVGLLVGPALVGQIAQGSDLPAALATLSVASAVMCLLAWRAAAAPDGASPAVQRVPNSVGRD